MRARDGPRIERTVRSNTRRAAMHGAAVGPYRGGYNSRGTIAGRLRDPMEPALKQRLIGAAVLVALAVIFLPMLVKGPAPESGVSDVPLELPDAPAGEYETRELPLVTPGDAPDSGVVGMDARSPDAAAASRHRSTTPTPPTGQHRDRRSATTAVSSPRRSPAAPASGTTAPAAAMLPAATAGGDFAVNFGASRPWPRPTGSSPRCAPRSCPATANRRPSTASRAARAHRALRDPRRGRGRAPARRACARRRRREGGDARCRQREHQARGRRTGCEAGRHAVATKPAEPASLSHRAPKPVAASGTGFAVQLAAFSKAADATALRDRLRSAGFSAFTEAVSTDKGTLTRVRVGPVLNRAEADQLKAQVKSKLGIDGIVRPHP